MKIAVTGHRPNKLWGYDLNNPKYKDLYLCIQKVLITNKCDYAISGMALGVDQVFAICAIKNKIYLECAIPCLKHSKMWKKESVDLYNKILSKSQKQTLVSPTAYNNVCMQIRNEYMVDNCNILLAVWDGSNGGTGNCVKYAQSIGKEIIRINPNEI